MFSLNDIFEQAHGGQAMQNLAEQFGLSTTQVQKAIEAVTPALSAGLQARAQDPQGLADLFGAMFNNQHQQAFEDPAAASSPQAAAEGEDALARLFGGAQAHQALAAHAAEMTGLSASMMQSMLPVIASMLMGGMFKGLAGSGLGGMLDQLGKAGAASPGNSSGGLAELLGGLFGGGAGQGGTAPTQTASSGLGGMLGGLFGGARSASPGHADQVLPPGFDASGLQGGLDMLGKMLGGSASSAGPAAQPELGDLLSQMFGQKQ